MAKRINKMLAFLLCLVMVVMLMPASIATATGNNDGNIENAEAFDDNLENEEALDDNLENAEELDGDLENVEELFGDSLLTNETSTPSATIFGTPELGSDDPLWAQTKEYLINKSTVPDDTRPHSTGTVRILWDFNYFYARVVVEDSNLYQGPGGDHQYDSLEFYVGTGSRGSNQWRVSATGVFSGQSATGRAAWTKITDTGYIVEMRIPKGTLTMQEGLFTFEVYINNSTEKGGDRYEVVSCFGDPDTAYNSASSFTNKLTLSSADEVDTRFSITAMAGPGGRITPNAPGDVLRVAAGSDKVFVVTPDYGKIVDTVTVDGENATLSDGTYTFSNVTANHTIQVTFKNDPTAKLLPFIVWNDNFAKGEYTTAVIIDLGEGKAAVGSMLNPDQFIVSARNTTLNGASVTFEGTRKITRVYANDEPKVRGYLGPVSNSPDYQAGLESGRYIVIEFEFYTEGGGTTTLDGSQNSTKQIYSIVQNGQLVLTDGSPLSYIVFEQEKVVNPILDKFTTPTGNSVNRALYLHKNENGEVLQGLPLYVYIHGMGRGGTNSAQDQKAAMKSANGAVALMKKMEENPGKYASHVLNISYNGTSTPSTANVKKVIDELVASGAVDPNRIYVAGFSWGGQYTNSLVNAFPGFFAAAAPMSPVSGSPNASTNEAHKELAYWMFINAYNVGGYQTNLDSFISTNMPNMTNARASRFESNEALSWPYVQYDQPNQRPNPDNTPALGDQVAHEVEAAVLYNQITMGTWSIAPIAQSSNLSAWNNDYTDVFDWMFAQKKPHVPSAPGSFSATAGSKQVTLSWTAPADDGGRTILGYKVWYDDETPVTLDAAATEYTYTGLTNGHSYTFKIVAVNEKGDSAEISVIATPSATIFGTPELGSDDPLWAQTKEYLINKSTVPSDTRPHSTGTVRILWDYDYLYARVVVEDSNLYQGPGGDHQYDSLEFYVGTGSRGSNQWRVSATGVFSGQSATGRAAWTKITDTGYIVEMRIPKGSLTMQEGQFTFEVYINNSTEKGGDRYEVVSCFGDPDAAYNGATSFTNKLTLSSADEVDNRFSITAIAGPGGRITPNAPGDVLRVEAGSDKVFVVNPDYGKIVDTVTVDGENATLSDGTYTFSNVTANHTIQVTFKNDPAAKLLPFIVWNDNFAKGEYTTAVIIDLGEGKAAVGSMLNPDQFIVSARNTTLNGASVTFEGTRKITRVYANDEPKVRGYLGPISNSPDYQAGLESGRYIVIEFEFYTEGGGTTTLDGSSNSTKQIYSIVQNGELVLTEGSPLSYIVFEQEKVVNPILDKFTTPTGNSVNRALYLHKNENGEVLQGLPLYVYIHGMGRGGTNSAQDQKAAMKSANGAVALMKKMEENPGKYASHVLNISYNGTSTPSTANVKKVIDELVASGAVDPNRIYVAGFSWGGQYTNSLVNAFPGFFAAAAPMSPVSGSPNASTNEAHKELAYWMFINAYNVGGYQTNLDSFISTNMPNMTNARASRFESNEALSWPYVQYDQPNQRPNPDNTPALGDQVAHEVEAAVLYNQITMGTWSIAPIAQSSNLPAWNNDYTDVFDWMFAQKKPHVPSAPGSFSATAGSKQVTLSWAAPVDDGGSAILGYKVWYNDESPVTLDAAATEYTFSGLTNGQGYTFKIVAVNAKGDSAEMSVMATPSVLVTGISLSKTSTSIIVGRSVILVATIIPEDATNPEDVIWTSSNTGVATVANGTITGVKAGTATITAKIGDISATCNVTVVRASSNEGGNGGNGGSGGNGTEDPNVPVTPTPTPIPTPPAIEEPTKPTEKLVTIADKTEKLIADKLLSLSADDETKEDIKALVNATTVKEIMDSFKDIVKDLKDSKSKAMVEQAANLTMLKVGTIDISKKSVKTEKGVAKVQITTDLAKQLLEKASLVAEIDKIIASYNKKVKTEVNFKKHVTLNLPTIKSDKSVYVELSSANVKELSKKVDAITVSSLILEIDVSLKALVAIKADKIAITASKPSTVSKELKKLAGKNEVYTVTCAKTTGKKTSSVLKLSVANKITIPVDIKKFNTKTVTVKCVQNGKVVKTIKAKVDNVAKALVFDSMYFGDFIIVK